METKIFEPEKDLGKARFQEELNRWFESRGIIADLRSHLRHLMITALQNQQVGAKATDRNSPKVQALSLMIAEYMFRHGCHYTLSVFTSEVPSLVNFNPEGALQVGKASQQKRVVGKCFKEEEVEEIFNALGMSSQEEELDRVKNRYFEKSSETTLLELFLQALVEMAMKLQIRRDLESHAEGERVLSETWSTRVINVLVGEKMTPSQVTALEETIFRITESEIKKILEEERRVRVKALTERERRIQEYLRKHEEEIFCRLTEAENELARRKDLIDEELGEREKHLTEMALEWKNKHEEILSLSKNFHSIENENRNLQMKIKELEENNKNLKAQGETQTKTIEELLGDMNLLITKLKEATESNSALSERIQVLISRENKEAFLRHDSANQEKEKAVQEEIPLLLSKKMHSESELNASPKKKAKEFSKTSQIPRPQHWKNAKASSGDAQRSEHVDSSEDGDTSMSSSSDEMILGMREKILHLEEQTNVLNQNYLEFKLKCTSANSDSESSERPDSPKSAPPIDVPDDVITKETKFCQTDTEDTFSKIQKLAEAKERKVEVEHVPSKKPEAASPKKTLLWAPTKRQLQNREFFLKSRQLLQALEKQNLGGLHTSMSSIDSVTYSSDEEPEENLPKKSPIKLTPVKAISACSGVEAKKRPSLERKPDGANQLPKSDADCLFLLGESRIPSPRVAASVPLRQQILLSESGDEKEDKTGAKAMSPSSISIEKLSVGRKSDGSW